MSVFRFPCHRRWATLLEVALACLVTVACLSRVETIPGASTAVPLSLEVPTLDRVGRLTYRGGLELQGDAGFGGLSSLSVLGDGNRFVAVSDVGAVIAGRLGYDDTGRLTEAGNFTTEPLLLEDGASEGKRGHDSEGLTRLPDGGWVVSFERHHRLLRYPRDFGRSGEPPVPLAVPPGLEDAPDNGGAEAVTTLADGRLLVLQEGAGGAEHPAWVGDGRRWERLAYRPERRFRPTDAAMLPDGDVLVLERRASFAGGFGARIVRLKAAALRAGAVLEGEELARLGPPLTIDNFEGIAVQPGADGEVRVWIVSDNNFSVFQRTLLLMFTLKS
ncbi:MAG TPA: esterase-like activity of phytase family protein [Azospirillaceae bacterium]|nr:esterase-like activity of phytase family protein [Azospirillaceae bacterium]